MGEATRFGYGIAGSFCPGQASPALSPLSRLFEESKCPSLGSPTIMMVFIIVDFQVCLMTRLLDDTGMFSYGLGHPMKPYRMRMTHNLVSAYGMLPKMTTLVGCIPPLSTVYWLQEKLTTTFHQRPRRSSPEEMTAFHTDEYIEFLAKVTPETVEELTFNGTRCRF
jgi:acetoin utilization deacetylase AcuC-like enzyme